MERGERNVKGFVLRNTGPGPDEWGIGRETESPKVGLEHKEVQKLWRRKVICLVLLSSRQI